MTKDFKHCANCGELYEADNLEICVACWNMIEAYVFDGKENTNVN